MRQDLPTIEYASTSDIPEIRWEVRCIRLGHQMGDVGENAIPGGSSCYAELRSLLRGTPIYGNDVP